jgi:hypothetical protein
MRWRGYWVGDWRIDRRDIASMSKLAAEVTGIPRLHELEADLFEEILVL